MWWGICGGGLQGFSMDLDCREESMYTAVILNANREIGVAN